MALPIQNAPVHNLQIPSTKETFKYRPFLVKEQKALLLAQQSEDPAVMIDTLKEVIKSCSKGTPINIDKLAVFDLEYIFSQMRAKSVGEYVDLYFFCDEDHGEENEKAKALVRVDLTQMQVEFNPDHQSKIPLFDDVGVVMKYPTIEVLKKIESMDAKEADLVFDIIIECIDYIYDKDEVHYAKEQSKEELKEFIDNLTQDQFIKVESFFNTMPKLRQKVHYKCPLCGKEHDKYLEGLNNFF